MVFRNKDFFKLEMILEIYVELSAVSRIYETEVWEEARFGGIYVGVIDTCAMLNSRKVEEIS